MNRTLQGGCQVPIGAFAEMEDNDHLWLRGLVGSVDGKRIIRSDISGRKNRRRNWGNYWQNSCWSRAPTKILRAVYGA